MSSSFPSEPPYSSRNPPPNNRQLLTLLGLFVGFVICVIWLLGLLAVSLIGWIPPSAERQLGAVFVPSFERLAKPSPAQDTLNQLLERLETKLPAQQRKERNYRVLYVPDSKVNALALPGDAIVIYSGLVAGAKSENELMMVLGHELGHFAHRDHLRSLGRTLLLKIAIAYFIGDADWLRSTAAASVEAVSRSHYSQSQETQADEFGLTLLQQTYGHVAGATDFFAGLMEKRNTNLAFLSTHPAPGDRVAKLELLIKQKNYGVGARSPLPATLAQQKS